MRDEKPGMGVVLTMPQAVDEPRDQETAIPRPGALRTALLAIASDLDVPVRCNPNWASDTVRAHARQMNDAKRTEHAHRETLRTIAAATRGKPLEDVPACFDAAPSRVVAEVLRMHEEIEVKARLVEAASQTIADLKNELEATRIELAKTRGE